WALLTTMIGCRWSSPLFERPAFAALMILQALAIVAYMASDLSRGSAPADLARGWARMGVLAFDIIAIAYLAGRTAGATLGLLLGLQTGFVLSALIQGPLFGDMWKFGIGAPITFAALVIAGRLGLI